MALVLTMQCSDAKLGLLGEESLASGLSVATWALIPAPGYAATLVYMHHKVVINITDLPANRS